MLLAELAILLDLHPVGMGLFVFGRIIVAVLALCASKRDPRTHGGSLRKENKWIILCINTDRSVLRTPAILQKFGIRPVGLLPHFCYIF